MQVSEILPSIKEAWLYYDKQKIYEKLRTEEKLNEVEYQARLKKEGFEETYIVKARE